MELFIKKIKEFFLNLNFQESFTTCKWDVMCMTYKTKLYFMILKKKPKVINIFWYGSNYDKFSRGESMVKYTKKVILPSEKIEICDK